MHVVSGPYAAALLLLGVAGITTLRRPTAVARSLRGAGLPVPPSAWRMLGWALGAAELGVAVAGLFLGGRVPAALATALYLGYAGFVALTLRRGGTAGCGCFGSVETPPGRTHVGVDLAAAAACLLALVSGPPASVGALLGGHPVQAVVLLGFAGLVTWFGYLALEELPRLRAAR